MRKILSQENIRLGTEIAEGLSPLLVNFDTSGITGFQRTTREIEETALAPDGSNTPEAKHAGWGRGDVTLDDLFYFKEYFLTTKLDDRLYSYPENLKSGIGAIGNYIPLIGGDLNDLAYYLGDLADITATTLEAHLYKKSIELYESNTDLFKNNLYYSYPGLALVDSIYTIVQIYLLSLPKSSHAKGMTYLQYFEEFVTSGILSNLASIMPRRAIGTAGRRGVFLKNFVIRSSDGKLVVNPRAAQIAEKRKKRYREDSGPREKLDGYGCPVATKSARQSVTGYVGLSEQLGTILLEIIKNNKTEIWDRVVK